MSGPVFVVSAWLGLAVLDAVLWLLGVWVIRLGYQWVTR